MGLYLGSTLISDYKITYEKKLVGIVITAEPERTEYAEGDTLDLSGLVVKAKYLNGASIDVTAECVFEPAEGDTLAAGRQDVMITYTEGDIVRTNQCSILVAEAEEVE